MRLAETTAAALPVPANVSSAIIRLVRPSKNGVVLRAFVNYEYSVRIRYAPMYYHRFLEANAPGVEATSLVLKVRIAVSAMLRRRSAKEPGRLQKCAHSLICVIYSALVFV